MATIIRSLNAFLMIALPLALGVILVRRYKVSWKLFGVGLATFIASQIFHLPFNYGFLLPSLRRIGLTGLSQGWSLALFALSLGLSAGLFEELARYLVYRFWLKEDRSSDQALMFGAGHGGAEAILIGAIALLSLIQALTYRGVDPIKLAAPDQAAALQAQLEIYWSFPWYQVLLGALERAFALCLHLSLTVIVLQAFTRSKLYWLGLAILWHTIVDGISVFSLQLWGVYITEALVGVMAVLSLIIIRALYTSPSITSLPQPDTIVSLPQLKRSDQSNIDSDRLDDSRYV
jgi:uncharacterized membrane protein YhfC